MSEEAARPGAWGAILDSISARLTDALNAVDQRAAPLPQPDGVTATASRQAELAQCDARLQELQRSAQRAAALAADTDLALASAEDLLRRRLAEAESLRHHLAAWAARAIG